MNISELERKKKKPQKILNRVSSSFTSALPSFFFLIQLSREIEIHGPLPSQNLNQLINL